MTGPKSNNGDRGDDPRDRPYQTIGASPVSLMCIPLDEAAQMINCRQAVKLHMKAWCRDSGYSWVKRMGIRHGDNIFTGLIMSCMAEALPGYARELTEDFWAKEESADGQR